MFIARPHAKLRRAHNNSVFKSNKYLLLLVTLFVRHCLNFMSYRPNYSTMVAPPAITHCRFFGTKRRYEFTSQVSHPYKYVGSFYACALYNNRWLSLLDDVSRSDRVFFCAVGTVDTGQWLPVALYSDRCRFALYAEVNNADIWCSGDVVWCQNLAQPNLFICEDGRYMFATE